MAAVVTTVGVGGARGAEVGRADDVVESDAELAWMSGAVGADGGATVVAGGGAAGGGGAMGAAVSG